MSDRKQLIDEIIKLHDANRLLHAEVERLKAKVEEQQNAICKMADLWPGDYWATLVGICGDHPCIKEATDERANPLG